MQKSKEPGSDMSAYLFVDTFVFEKLAAQPECRIGQRDAKMTGYEAYIIEQWACQRRINTVVASYTGNSQHVIEVQVLLVPSNLDQWSQVTLSHFEELVRMHILPKATPLGNMLVASLSSLPSNLSLISTTRQFRQSYAYFAANENLRRLSVVGRIAVTADSPSDSIVATFRRVFLIPVAVNAIYAVQEVTTLIQISLFYFGMLEPNIVDGLLCDHTLKAIENWWIIIGKQRFRVTVPRPQDKLYMRTTCAALVGCVTGARQRFSALGLKPPKDPFDAENFVNCIRRFQKLVKIAKTQRLDNETYFKLIHETAKIGSSGSSNVLTAMKSTVKEGISGKAREAVGDWETLNLEQLTHNVRGERAKFLWQGKGSEKAAHLIASLPVNETGPRTGIPLMSLVKDDTEKHQTHKHQRRESSLEAENMHSRQGSTHPDSVPASSEVIDHELNTNHSATPTDVAHDSSLVSRFRNRKGSILQEAFDDRGVNNSQAVSSAEPPPSIYAHMRSKSTSSDQWFAKHFQSMSHSSQGIEEGVPLVGESSELTITEHSSPTRNGQIDTPQNYSLDVSASTLLTRDDQDLEKKLHDPDISRRTLSLSEIDEQVFTWDSLAPVPQLLTTYEKARDLQAKVSKRMECDETIKRKVETDIRDNEAALSEAQRENVLIKYHVNASQKKVEAIHHRVKELEAFMARLDYELATLIVKLKDVDQSVMAFAAKVDSANRKWVGLKTSNVKPWWRAMISWFI